MSSFKTSVIKKDTKTTCTSPFLFKEQDLLTDPQVTAAAKDVPRLQLFELQHLKYSAFI